jgi:hypothetical protein
MEVTALREPVCLTCRESGLGQGVSKMSYFGGDAYAEACRRASEASSDSLARDWSVVAATIARRSGRRSSVLDALFG